MQFLLDARWLAGEAKARGVKEPTVAEVTQRFDLLRGQTFPGNALSSYLSRTGQSVADLRYRVRVLLLEEAIRNDVRGSGSFAAQRARINRFTREFPRRWRARTSCAPAYYVAGAFGDRKLANP